MSTLQTIIDRNRRLNFVDEYQYTNAQALEDANYRIHQIEDYITSDIWEWFFWDILKVDTTVIWQNEYSLPVISTGAFNWVPKIENISIKYQTWWDYIKAREVNRQTLDYDMSWYEVNQSESEPIYFIADNSYFIFPTPKVAIVDGIKLYWIKSLADVTLTTTYEELFGWKIPSKYYDKIDLTEFILRWQWQKEKADAEKAVFERVTLPNLVDRLWNRKVWISLRQPADVSKLK